MFEFFILNGLNDGPRSVFDIQARFRRIERFLDPAAARKGKRSVGSLPAVLEKLQREGLLKLENSGSQEAYSLTDAGVQRIQLECARRNSIVSQFIEDRELDASFRRFLNPNGPPGSN